MQGRILPNANMLEGFRKQGVAMEVVPGNLADGEDSLILRIGKPDSVGFYLETTVLPNKGYVMASAMVRMNGVVMSQDVYSGFVEISPGVWVATQIAQKAKRLDKDGVPYVSSEVEAIAVQKPTANCVVNDDVFDIRPTASTLLIDRRGGRSRSFLLPSVRDEYTQLIRSPSDLPVEPVSSIRNGGATGVGEDRDAPTVEGQETETRRNRELVLRPLFFGGFLTVGAICGMLVLRRWRKGKRSA